MAVVLLCVLGLGDQVAILILIVVQPDPLVQPLLRCNFGPRDETTTHGINTKN